MPTALTCVEPPPLPAPPTPETWGFVEALKEPPTWRVQWTDDAPPEEALELRGGLRLEAGFPDEEGLLATAETDLLRFVEQAGLATDGEVALRTERVGELSGETFRLVVEEAGIRLQAGELEGIRRGLYEVQERLRSSPGPWLRQGTTERSFWVKNRISRCFFGPIKRPPFSRDELLDEVDYYPDEYLHRLARDGVNGLWLTLEFADLCETSLTELPADGERRLAKLRRTVEACRRFGIRIWAFAIEPRGFDADDPLLTRYPELRGGQVGTDYCFCPSTETAQRYLRECTSWLFSQVPHLGGLMMINHGERSTTCLSSVACCEEIPVSCPRCRELPKPQILANALRPMYEGMKAAAPEAEMISWLYMPTPLPRANWVFDVPEAIPEGVILQYNFESNLMKTQLDVPRIGGDYWLSEVGPSTDFERVAARAAIAGTPLSAKLQVGCSHEVASVPFVPLPVQLYRKYREMRRLGCSQAMQCWYFGNYPGLMNRAATALASEAIELPEEEFLLHLARPDWGEDAATVVRAWQLLAEAYRHYPLTNTFQYYGPVTDGVAWPLFLRPRLAPLLSNWQHHDEPSGDTIGDCLQHMSLPEALFLLEELATGWAEGTALLTALRPRYGDDPDRLRDIDLAEALAIQFASCRNILRFYLLREELPGRPARLEELRELVEAEISHSERMVELCERDPRLGFHPEAETYKYFPAKLRWRMDWLRTLLREEFPAVSAALAAGQDLLPDRPTYVAGAGWREAEHFRWRLDWGEAGVSARVECPGVPEGYEIYMRLYLSDAYGTRFFREYGCTREGPILLNRWSRVSVERTAEGGLRAHFQVPSLTWHQDPGSKPVWIRLVFLAVGPGRQLAEAWPPTEPKPSTRLRLFYFNPLYMARLLPADAE